MTPDITGIKRMLLDDFIATGAEQDEIDAFMTGMVWLEEELAKKDRHPARLNDETPHVTVIRNLKQSYRKAISDVLALYEEAKTDKDALQRRYEALQAELDNHMRLSSRDLSELRMNGEYRRMQFLVHSMELDRNHWLETIRRLREQLEEKP